MTTYKAEQEKRGFRVLGYDKEEKGKLQRPLNLIRNERKRAKR